MVQARINARCNYTINPARAADEHATHRLKVESMNQKRAELEAWIDSMTSTPSTKHVIDCIDQNYLPRRYDALTLPSMSSGFGKMPLISDCRRHKCKANQCLVVKMDCPPPWIKSGKEVEMCPRRPPQPSVECVDKVGIMGNSPLGFGFGICWIVLGIASCSTCCRTFMKRREQKEKVRDISPAPIDVQPPSGTDTDPRQCEELTPAASAPELSASLPSASEPTNVLPPTQGVDEAATLDVQV